MKNTNPWINNPVLFRSVLRDNYETFVEKLYNYNSIMNTPNIYGENLLHYACFLGMVDKYDALVNFEAKIEKTQEGNSLLHYSSYSGYDNFLVIELVKSGLIPNDRNHKNQTPIHFSGNDTICQYFSVWAHNHNIHIPSLLDDCGNTVAHTSIQNNKKDSYNFWIRKFPELSNIKNYYGLIPENIKSSPRPNFCTFIGL